MGCMTQSGRRAMLASDSLTGSLGEATKGFSAHE